MVNGERSRFISPCRAIKISTFFSATQTRHGAVQSARHYTNGTVRRRLLVLTNAVLLIESVDLGIKSLRLINASVRRRGYSVSTRPCK